MKKKKQGYRGRPTAPAIPGQRSTVSLRLTAETKTKIDEAAKANGRPFSQEAELRLEQSFEREELFMSYALGRPLAAFLQAAGYASRMTGRFTGMTEPREEDGKFIITTDWPSNSLPLRTAILMLRVLNEPFSELATALRSPRKIPKHIIEAEGEQECTTIALALQYLIKGQDEWKPIRERLFNIAVELDDPEPSKATSNAR